MKRFTFVIILWVILTGGITVAQEATVPETHVQALEKRLLALEEKVAERRAGWKTETDRIKQMEALFDRDFQVTKDQLKNDFHSLKNELRETLLSEKESLEELKYGVKNNTLTLNIFLLFLITALGIGLFTFTRKTVVKILSGKFGIPVEELDSLFTEVKQDYKIKKTGKILVVTPDYGNDGFLKSFLRQMNFPLIDAAGPGPGVRFLPLPGIDPKEADADLVLFNDEDGRPPAPPNDEKASTDYKKELKGIEDHLAAYGMETVRLYFGPKVIHRTRDDIAMEIKQRTSFSNARLQLYGNLMNALRYSRKIRNPGKRPENG